jgi:tripartite-type tricarboxylate transporter receptor subunit TctC
MIVGFASGGGTDAAGRLIANFLGKHLPGQPNVVVRNMPGADGMTSMNYFVQQTRPDGLTVTMGSTSQADPLNWRKAIAHYNPAEFKLVGGVGRGGLVTLISKDTEKRLYDKSAEPVIMGSNSAVPRDGMQVTMWGIEFLGWNAKWVVGYPGTNEVMLALERGEVEMSSTGNLFLIEKLVGNGAFKPLAQTGRLSDGKIMPRAEFGAAPLVSDLMKGKTKDPLAEKAFAHWRSLTTVDKWVALVPGTPDEILAVYRDAFIKVSADPDFLAQGTKISDGFFPMSASDTEDLIVTLANTPPEALEYTKGLMRKQGLRVE